MEKTNPCLTCPVRGDCCYFAVQKSNGEVIGLKSCPCKYLGADGLCKAYNSRFEKVKDCLTAEKAIIKRALPNECPYVKNLPNYKGKIFVSREEEKKLIKAMIESGKPVPDYLSSNFLELISKSRANQK